MARKKSKNLMTKAERKRMSSLNKAISRERQYRNQAINKISKMQDKQSKLIKRAKARKR
jgi:hypothetical protein